MNTLFLYQQIMCSKWHPDFIIIFMNTLLQSADVISQMSIEEKTQRRRSLLNSVISFTLNTFHPVLTTICHVVLDKVRLMFPGCYFPRHDVTLKPGTLRNSREENGKLKLGTVSKIFSSHTQPHNLSHIEYSFGSPPYI